MTNLKRSNPRERLLGYVDFRAAILSGPLPEFTCLLGTMVQGTYETHPAIREAGDKYISDRGPIEAIDNTSRHFSINDKFRDRSRPH
jgi:TetR/AcrR family transcriptional repressor of nem operon